MPVTRCMGLSAVGGTLASILKRYCFATTRRSLLIASQRPFDAGKRFMDAAPSTPPRDDYHRAILSQLGIHDPSNDLLTELD